MTGLIVKYYESDNRNFFGIAENNAKSYKRLMESGLAKPTSISNISFWKSHVCIHLNDSYGQLYGNTDHACATIVATTEKGVEEVKSHLEKLAGGLVLNESEEE